MPFIPTTRTSLFIADHRKPGSARTPTLLIHGAGDSRLIWPGQLRRLPEADAIVLDLPGHGKSPGPARDRVEHYAADVIALLDALRIDRAVLCGHSMGGAIAQQIALDYSDRAAGLILIATGAKLAVSPLILDRVRDDQEAVARLLADWLWTDAAPPERRAHTIQSVMTTPAAVIYADYLACNRFDVRARLGEISARALVIGGTEDRMTPFKFSEVLAAQLPHADLIRVEGAGHMLMLEQPDTVAAAVADWLRRG